MYDPKTKVQWEHIDLSSNELADLPEVIHVESFSFLPLYFIPTSSPLSDIPPFRFPHSRSASSPLAITIASLFILQSAVVFWDRLLSLKLGGNKLKECAYKSVAEGKIERVCVCGVRVCAVIKRKVNLKLSPQQRACK